MGIKKIKNFPFEGCIAARDNLCWVCKGNLPVPIHFFSPLFYPVGRGFGSALTGQYADVAQSAEHRAGRYAAGSNPAVCTIGVTSCLAAARSVSLRKWSFLRAVRKRWDDVIYLLAGTGFVKMNGCDRRTGAGLKSSVVGLGDGVCGENPRRNL